MKLHRTAFLFALVWLATILLMQWWKYSQYGYNALDLAIYSQTTWSLANGHNFATSLQGHSYLADHVEPVLLLLAPLYKLFSTPLTLLVTQSIALAVAIYLLLSFASTVVQHPWRRFAYCIILVNPIWWNVALYEFHAIALAAPIVVGSILAFQQRLFRRWVALLVLLAMWREDMPLLVAGWSLLSIFERRPKTWILFPLLIAGVGVAIDQAILANVTTHGYKYLAFYRGLGSSVRDILLSPIQHPVIFLTTLFHPNNWATVGGLLATVGGLALFRTRWLLPLLFTGLQLLLLHADPRAILRLHYFSIVIPFFIVAALYGLQQAPSRIQALRARVSRLPSELWVSCSVSLLLLSIAVFSPATWIMQRQRLTAPSSTITLALGHISPSDSVVASFAPLPNLANRSSLYSLHYLFLGHLQFEESDYTLPQTPDAILIDRRQWFEYLSLYKKTERNGVTGYDRFETLLASANYKVVFDEDDVVVWKKSITTPSITYHATTPQTITLQHLEATAVTSYLESDPSKTKTSLRWRMTSANDAPITLRFRWMRNDSVVAAKILVLANGATPVYRPALGEKGSFFTTTTFSNTQPDRLVVDEVTYRSEYLLQSWHTFRPVLYNLKSLSSATIQLAPRQ